MGAGVLCVHLHRRPGIDRGGGFFVYRRAAGLGVRLQSRWWGEWEKKD
jgi:hypothetical protein